MPAARPLSGPDDPRHGTNHAYTNYACRCRRCTTAHAAESQRYKLGRRLVAACRCPRRVVGRTYLLHGVPVVVLARWHGTLCPRNVLLQLPDGTKTVRPFRGLRVLRS